MSICSIASESKKLLAMNGIAVAVCTAHREPRMLRYTKFDNDIHILAFSDLLPRFPTGSDILVHVPEMFVGKYVTDCLSIYQSRPDVKWRFNVLLQNIDLIPSRDLIEVLMQVGTTTATVAHKAYATAETARRLGCPVHFLSTYVCPENYHYVEYSNKDKLIVISPDPHPAKSEIVCQIANALPDYKIVEIRNMTYRKYRSIIKHAKFAFTFGEGLDSYFVEPIFSGGVAMAIFNERFFTDEYRDLDGVFLDSEDAISHVTEFLRSTDNEKQYRTVAKQQYRQVAKDYVRHEYLQNILAYYDKYYN